MRPASKIPHCTVGPRDQNLLFPVNQSLALVPSNPATPVSENFGNRSAVATPIRAVEAASCRSACWTSGRRRSRSDGSPAGTLGGGRNGSRRRQLRQEGFGWPAQEHAKAVDITLDAASRALE